MSDRIEPHTRPDNEQTFVIPAIAEQVEVITHQVDSGRGVRVEKQVRHDEHRVETPVLQEELLTERIVFDLVVDASAPPVARYEGDTFIIPVLEEVLVVQKQLRLKEEVRITRVRHQAITEQTVVLRSEQVTTHRFNQADMQQAAPATSFD